MIALRPLLAIVLAAVPFGMAQAGTPLRPLLQDQAHAVDIAAHASAELAAQRQALRDRTADIGAAEILLRNARTSTGIDNKALATAMDSLARAKSGCDAAVDRERTTMITSVQADARARAARQTMTDAVTGWTAEGEALERAAARAAVGETARTARENTACLDQDCSPIPPAEHTALVIMGAVSATFDPRDWPPDAAPQMTLLPAATVNAFVLRSLREAVAENAKEVQATATALNAARAAVNSTRPDSDAAVQSLLDTYFRPTGQRGETLQAAIDNVIALHDATPSAAEAYRAASVAADAAKAKQPAAEARLNDALVLFGDQGRAVQRAARLAARGYLLTGSQAGLAICRGKVCEPTSGLEAAAFLVIGAATPGAEKNLAALVAATADRRWTFKTPK